MIPFWKVNSFLKDLEVRHANRMIYAAEVNILWQETNIKDTLILNLHIANAQLNLILLIAV